MMSNDEAKFLHKQVFANRGNQMVIYMQEYM